MKGFIKILSGLLVTLQTFGIVPMSHAQSIDEQRWQYAISVLLKQEGGYSDDKIDPGGSTNYGISLRYLESIGQDIDGDGDIDRDDIKVLTRDEAIKIYRKNWWDKYGYNKIRDLDVATKVFSMSVNMGSIRAHKLLQISINRMNDKPIAVDGKLGVMTLNAVNNANLLILLDEIKLNCAHFYINLIADKPKLNKYLLGWMRRAFD